MLPTPGEAARRKIPNAVILTAGAGEMDAAGPRGRGAHAVDPLVEVGPGVAIPAL